MRLENNNSAGIIIIQGFHFILVLR